MRKIIFFLAVQIAFVACSKSSEPDSITQRFGFLSNNTTLGFGKWKLQGIDIGLVSQTLTGSQASFETIYQSNGKFYNSDGLTGSWKLPTQDSLIEYFSNFNSGIIVEQKYRINILTPNQLSLSHVVNGTEITTKFKAAP